MNSRVVINGVEYQAGGSLVVVRRGSKVFVNDQEVVTESKEIKIEVHGNLETIDADACHSITVNGTVGSVKTLSGSVRCGDVTGNVSTMSGTVSSGKIGGNVSTMSGDVISR